MDPERGFEFFLSVALEFGEIRDTPVSRRHTNDTVEDGY